MRLSPGIAGQQTEGKKQAPKHAVQVPLLPLSLGSFSAWSWLISIRICSPKLCFFPMRSASFNLLNNQTNHVIYEHLKRRRSREPKTGQRQTTLVDRNPITSAVRTGRAIQTLEANMNQCDEHTLQSDSICRNQVGVCGGAFYTEAVVRHM